jgi:hypothetical protein
VAVVGSLYVVGIKAWYSTMCLYKLCDNHDDDDDDDDDYHYIDN